MEGLKPILERRSCRSYTDQNVPGEVVEKLLCAGMYAPSAHNSQPWEFLVMRETEKKKAASGLGKYWRMLKKRSARHTGAGEPERIQGFISGFFCTGLFGSRREHTSRRSCDGARRRMARALSERRQDGRLAKDIWYTPKHNSVFDSFDRLSR